MRLLLLLFIMLSGSLVASESPPAFPLWDGQESVEQYAKKVNLPSTKTLDLGNGVQMELVLIPAGKFIMGTPEPTQPEETAVVGQAILVLGIAAVLLPLLIVALRARIRKKRPNFSLLFLLALVLAASIAVYGGVRWHKTNVAWLEYAAAKATYDSADQSEKPAHPVMLTVPFYMGRFVVTQEQYQAVIGTNPSEFKGKDNPVETVSWYGAQAFCKKLSELTHLAARLPTEAEWEYACRAGKATTYFSGDTDKDLDRVAWYDANSKTTTHPVGQKEANVFGLFDMHGNVWQWCQDRYGADYYRSSPTSDPQGPKEPKHEVITVGYDRYHLQVIRGGSWSDDLDDCRSSFRGITDPGKGFNIIGFRVIMALADE
jgi:formylglycine-generating enzyme required for sulfatase activity